MVPKLHKNILEKDPTTHLSYIEHVCSKVYTDMD